MTRSVTVTVMVAFFLFSMMTVAPEETKKDSGGSDQERNYIRHDFVNDNKVVLSTVRATNYNILRDISELNAGNYAPFFMEINRDVAYLMYKKIEHPRLGKYSVYQETIITEDDFPKQIRNSFYRILDRKIPIAFSVANGNSLWYLPDPREGLIDMDIAAKKDKVGLLYGASLGEFSSKLRKQTPSMIPFAFDMSGNQFSTYLIPSETVTIRDIKIATCPIENVTYPEGWDIIGCKIIDDTMYMLVVQFDRK